MDITCKTDLCPGDTSVAVDPTVERSDEAACKWISDSLHEMGLWRIPGHPQEQRRVWRISPEPFVLSAECVSFLERLGPALYSFYEAANSLYLRGSHPWFNNYLDLGKPESLIEYAHMRFQRRGLPAVIRPDIVLGEEADYITELDSVPGGIGLMDGLSTLYGKLGFDLLGGERGMLRGFAGAVGSTAGQDGRPSVAIVISEESEDYRAEMEYLASEMRSAGWSALAPRPEQVIFTEDGLFFDDDLGGGRIDALYRFFELFDLKNIPKAELMMYAARKKRVAVTPPYKHHLEEKSLLALFHHPLLEGEWRRLLGEDSFDLLRTAIPNTWILDSRPAPPHTIIPDFQFRKAFINDWRVLKDASQKERRLVIKPSGFSPLAWGSRGVVVGHDVSQEEWASALENGLNSFETLPYVLQRFHEGKRFVVRYYDEETAGVREMTGRVRLSPYYFVSDGTAKLGGALATICPPDKKLIHGMVDAIMVPCAVGMTKTSP
ncbi:MAG: hypothetical protein Q7T82_17405 [Armatimonadota bacterium]|nr:hypothetical protein [Armatimonadota bacterium]